MTTSARAVTTKLIDMMDSGELDARTVAIAALNWLSEQSVANMNELFDLIPEEDVCDVCGCFECECDEEEEEEEEHDGHPKLHFIGLG